MQHMQFNLMIPGRAVKRIIIASLVIWLVALVLVENLFLSQPYITRTFGLIPKTVMESLFVWQVATYMFLHSLNPMHVLFNMLSLWFFGSELEMRWGTKQFFTYYVVTGIGAGVLYILGVAIYGMITGQEPPVYREPVVGASGAVFAILLAYGILFGDRQIYMFGAFPMPAKYFVMIIGLIEVVSLMTAGFSGGVANLAHLGGLVSGFLYLVFWTRFNQFRWRKTGETRRNLKLVVNRDKADKSDPKYWN